MLFALSAATTAMLGSVAVALIGATATITAAVVKMRSEKAAAARSARAEFEAGLLEWTSDLVEGLQRDNDRLRAALAGCEADKAELLSRLERAMRKLE